MRPISTMPSRMVNRTGPGWRTRWPQRRAGPPQRRNSRRMSGHDHGDRGRTLVGGVQLPIHPFGPFNPKVVVAGAKTELKGAVVVTVTYFLMPRRRAGRSRRRPACRGRIRRTFEAAASRRSRPVAFCCRRGLVLLESALLALPRMPYCAPSRAPCSSADFSRLKRPRSSRPTSSRNRIGSARANSITKLPRRSATTVASGGATVTRP